MFRSALDALDVLGQFRKRRITLHMIDLGGDVTANGISKLVFTILSAVAEAERDRIRERVATVKQDQRARGRYLGGIVPFGWRLGGDGALVAVPAQQEAIRRMREMRAAGASLRSQPRRGRPDIGFPTKPCAASWPAPADRSSMAGAREMTMLRLDLAAWAKLRRAAIKAVE